MLNGHPAPIVDRIMQRADPNANLMEQEARIIALQQSNLRWPDVRDWNGDLNYLRSELRIWLQRGGHEPDWSKAPNARKYYVR
jgi:hypothetical protein